MRCACCAFGRFDGGHVDGRERIAGRQTGPLLPDNGNNSQAMRSAAPAHDGLQVVAGLSCRMRPSTTSCDRPWRRRSQEPTLSGRFRFGEPVFRSALAYTCQPKSRCGRAETSRKCGRALRSSAGRRRLAVWRYCRRARQQRRQHDTFNWPSPVSRRSTHSACRGRKESGSIRRQSQRPVDKGQSPVGSQASQC